eukprot:Lankesteria_metandrocarpae@DN881_c0_g1_i1.p1
MSTKFYSRLAEGTGTSGIPFKSKFGSSILKQCGWNEGDGLGRDKNGIKECIQVSKRESGLGLGGASKAENAASRWHNWWDQLYDSVASSIDTTGALSQNSFTSLGSSDDSSDESDNEEGKCTAVAGVGGRRAALLQGKQKRIAESESTPKDAQKKQQDLNVEVATKTKTGRRKRTREKVETTKAPREKRTKMCS